MGKQQKKLNVRVIYLICKEIIGEGKITKINYHLKQDSFFCFVLFQVGYCVDSYFNSSVNDVQGVAFLNKNFVNISHNKTCDEYPGKKRS